MTVFDHHCSGHQRHIGGCYPAGRVYHGDFRTDAQNQAVTANESTIAAAVGAKATPSCQSIPNV